MGKDIDKVQPLLLDLLEIGLAVSGADISAEKNFIDRKRQAVIWSEAGPISYGGPMKST
ncbi:MAG TPA: hypothetical protein VGW77_02895 [Candidatus Binatia bacterium]|nr:hypothetical protein [Candidatus Binatia bacterium]